MKKYLKFLVLPLLSIVVFLLTGCGSKERKITYYVDNQIWKEVSIKADEVIAKPDISTIENKDKFVFDDWYTDDKFTTKFTKWNQKLDTKKLNLYAKFNTINVEVLIKGESEAIKTTLDKLDISLVPKKDNLTVDGFYVDDKYTTLYENQKDITTFYARYVAVVTYTNLYEDLLSLKLEPGEKARELTAEELNKFYYMDKTNLTYYLSDVKTPFDFNSEISANTTIKVQFQNHKMLFESFATDKFVLTGFDFSDKDSKYFESLPVISFPSFIISEDKKYEISAVKLSFVNFYSAKTIIFNDGIQVIDSFSANSFVGDKMNCETIILPKTLKIIKGSFNSFPELKNVELPQSLEVITTSFYKTAKLFDDTIIVAVGENGFVLNIPSSVKYLFDIPCNVKFAEGSKFYQDTNKNIYYNNDEGKKVLAVYNKNLNQETVKVDDSVEYIQAGAFEYAGIKVLDLPTNYAGYIKFDVYTPYKDLYLLPSYDTLFIYGFNFYNVDDGYSMFQYERIYTSLISLSFKFFDKIICHKKLSDAFASEDIGFFKFEEFRFVNVEDDEVFIKLYTTHQYNDGENITVFAKLHNIESNKVVVKKITAPAGTAIPEASFTADIVNTVEKIVKAFDNSGNQIDYKNFKTNTKVLITLELRYVSYGITYENLIKDGVDTGELIVTGFDEPTAIEDPNDNTKILVIPDEINNKKVTTIKEQAFKNNQKISQLIIGKNITTIGAEAFYNCLNLIVCHNASRIINFIGRSAFENTNLYSFTINLENVKTIEPFAFKILSLNSFIDFDNSKKRVVLSLFNRDNRFSHLVGHENEYFFITDDISNYAIVKYIKQGYEHPTHAIKGEEEYGERLVCDVQLVSYCPGIGTRELNIGQIFPYAYKDCVVRYELLEGSAYFIKEIKFGLLSKIRRNAITSVNPEIYSISSDNADYISYVNDKSHKWFIYKDLENPEIAEDGFFEGFLKGSTEYNKIMNVLSKMRSTSANLI